MTDEKLDQLLKQALAPEIEDNDIQVRRKEKGIMNKRKSFLSGLAACAALALLVMGIFLGGILKPGAVAEKANDKTMKPGNIFAVTAYAEELPENAASGDVVGLRFIQAGSGSSAYLDQRFAISGQNIESVRITTDKCELYTMVPVYRDDPEFELAETAETDYREFYEAILDGEPEEEHHEVDHYEHLQIVGPNYEGAYNAEMCFGMSVPKELWSNTDNPKQAFWEDVDQVNGAALTICVTFTDGSTEEHHYKVNTGKIYVPHDDAGTNQWGRLTRFLTPAEENAATPFIYGYLMEKVD